MSQYELHFQFVGAMCLKCAAQLAIPDKISNHGQPMTLPELISALHLHPNRTAGLNQLMRFLVCRGLFSKTKIGLEDAYSVASCSNLLLSDIDTAIRTANSVASSVFSYLQPFLPEVLKAWQNLGDWFLGQEPITPFQSANGIGFWDAVYNSPHRHLCHEFMKKDTMMFIQSSIEGCFPAFEGLESLVDVGGGTGALANSISQAFPRLKCTVFDLPEVLENMQEPNHGKVNYIIGDMFQSIPPADAVLMKTVLHNWSDENCLEIFRNCKAAISHRGKQGKLIIIDIVIDEENDTEELSRLKLSLDMIMLSFVNGKERNEEEWKKLFFEAGYCDCKITPLLGSRSLIEVFP